MNSYMHNYMIHMHMYLHIQCLYTHSMMYCGVHVCKYWQYVCTHFSMNSQFLLLLCQCTYVGVYICFGESVVMLLCLCSLCLRVMQANLHVMGWQILTSDGGNEHGQRLCSGCYHFSGSWGALSWRKDCQTGAS